MIQTISKTIKTNGKNQHNSLDLVIVFELTWGADLNNISKQRHIERNEERK